MTITGTGTALRGLALLDAAISHIEAHPETWAQDVYRCRTGCCLAGHIALLAGGRWASSLPADEHMAREPGDEDLGGYCCEPGLTHVADRARRLLGFSEYMPDGRSLFRGQNTLDDIRAMRDELAAAGTP